MNVKLTARRAEWPAAALESSACRRGNAVSRELIRELSLLTTVQARFLKE